MKKMDSAESSVVDDTANMLDTDNMQASLENIIISKYEEPNAEVVSSQSEEAVEQCYFDSENGTIYIGSQRINLKGKRVLVTENNEFYIVDSDVIFVDSDTIQLEETLPSTSVVQPEDVAFEDDLQEQGALAKSETQEEFVSSTTEEETLKNEETVLKLENNEEISTFLSKNNSPDAEKNESPIWTVTNTADISNDNNEMIFFPTPAVVQVSNTISPLIHVPADTKNMPLMQLAYVAHKLQSTDQKSDDPPVESQINNELLSNEIENSTIVSQTEIKNELTSSILLPDHENCTNHQNSENVSSYSTESEKTSVVTSCDPVSDLPVVISKAVSNTVSVIHTITSELQDICQEKDNASFLSENAINRKSESNLPSEMCSNVSTAPLQDTVDPLKGLCKDKLSDKSTSLNVYSVLEGSSSCNQKSTISKEKNFTDILNSERNSLISDTDEILNEIENKCRKIDGDVTNINKYPKVIFTQKSYLRKKGNVADKDSSDIDSLSPNINNNTNISADELQDNFSFSETESVIHSFKSKFRYSVTDLKDRSVSKKIVESYPQNESPNNILKIDESETEQSLSLLENDKNSSVVNDTLKSNSSISETLSEFKKPQEPDLDDSEVTKIGAMGNKQITTIETETAESDICSTLQNFTHSVSEDITELSHLSNSLTENSLDKTESLHSQDTITEETGIMNSTHEERKFSSDAEIDLSENVSKSTSLNSSDTNNNKQISVKSPLKTYDRKRNKESKKDKMHIQEVELYGDPCEKDTNNGDSLLMDHSQDNIMSPSDNSIYDIPDHTQEKEASSSDNFIYDIPIDSELQKKVVATYSVKRKNTQNRLEQILRNLRTRDSSALTKETSNKNASQVKSDEHQNLPWGHILQQTEFQNCNISQDTPSTSSAPPLYLDNKTTTPQPKKRKSSADENWERFINSSTPKNSKRPKTNNIRGKIRRPLFSKLIKDSFARVSKWKKIDKNALRQEEENKSKSSNVYGITQLRQNLNTNMHKEEDSERKKELLKKVKFHCFNCNDFSATRVNVLIYHLKYCSKEPHSTDPRNLEYPVFDMVKRQRIRGDNSKDDDMDYKRILDGISAISRQLNEDLEKLHNDDDDQDGKMNDLEEKKNKFGYAEDDVVWAKVKNRFWPGLVCELTDEKASIILINYPDSKNGLKLSVRRIHTFDDAKWNKMLLAEAANLNHKDIFIKAVQTSETFVRKKWLGMNVNGKEFFSIPGEVQFETDNESSDSESYEMAVDDFDIVSRGQRAYYNKLNIKGIVDYILKGKVDKYLVDIFEERVKHERHMKFDSKTKRNTHLLERNHFGPCEGTFEGVLVDYFHNLFLERLGLDSFSPTYILSVWTPVAIIKAIADFYKLPLDKAEAVFEGDELIDEVLADTRTTRQTKKIDT